MSTEPALGDADAREIARLAAVGSVEDDANELTERVVHIAVRRVPDCVAAALTLDSDSGGYTFAASDPRIELLHALQFDAREGPVVETLRHAEPRRMDDPAEETRWPGFVAAAQEAGLCTCLVLPIRTDTRPVGALALYGEAPGTFAAAGHDISVLLAAQTGVAVHNAKAYADARQLIDHLHTALRTRGWIEQAKVIVATEHQLTPDEAFALLTRQSQSGNRKLWQVARDLVEAKFGPSDATATATRDET